MRSLLALALVVAPTLSAAQSVRGVVVDERDTPLGGVLMQLVDSASRVRLRALSNGRGEFRLDAPSSGTYVIRATRIGYRPASIPAIVLTGGTETTRRVVLASMPVILDPITSTSSTSCRMAGLDSTAATFAAWEQVRAALSATDLTSEQGSFVTTALSYERRLALDGTLLSQTGHVHTAALAQPWTSLSADSLSKVGYVVVTPDGSSRVFHGPDARVLSSDRFVEDHCFRMVASDDSTRIGVAFEPVPARKGKPEIIGTMWVDRSTAELRELQFQFVNVARDVDDTATGGRMVFQRLSNGAWVISRWQIRMPLVEMIVETRDAAVRFRGVKIAGGEIITAMAPTGRDTIWSGSRMTMRGFAYDSLGESAVRAALIGIEGTRRTAVTDSGGKFAFNDMLPGVHRLVMQHDALEAIGVPYQVTRVVLSSDDDFINISIPSFATIWRLACESAPPVADTALVYGRVRAAGGAEPVANATVVASWVDIVESGRRRFTTRRWHLDDMSDSTGSYVLCGVPTQTGLRLRAVSDSGQSGLIDLLPLEKSLVYRRDMVLGPERGGRGTVAGRVVGPNSAPIGGARVVADGVREVRTDSKGGFVLDDVPLGTQQIEVLAVGLQPVSSIVDVSTADTARVEIVITRPVVLQTMNVVASSVRRQFVADFAARRDKGIGLFRDSMSISMHATLNSLFAQMPAVRMARDSLFLPAVVGTCVPIVWIDGVHVQTVSDLMALRPTDLAAIELYARDLTVPMQFIVRNTRTRPCGVIVAWTKWYWEGNRPRPPG